MAQLRQERNECFAWKQNMCDLQQERPVTLRPEGKTIEDDFRPSPKGQITQGHGGHGKNPGLCPKCDERNQAG